MMDKIQHKIVTKDFFEQQEESLHQRKIVFTNGCFDVLHYGHVHYLAQAKELGDILVVGLNSDASVRRLKGEGRPVNPEHARAYVLAALEMVDYVCLFEEDTPYNLIAAVQPDVLVKGGDYVIDNIVGGDIVKKRNGEVVVLPFVEGFSSTMIIEKSK
ncbi:MAG: D-glycero-beta-D-manno-heptose 1-phosphate adenylyltransferase [Bacteroidales bacterium]|nr:D-glycero-beta-D-manno-heptose 1-phosphate adenylyltransferase [Bacteroidales bacterium]